MPGVVQRLSEKLYREKPDLGYYVDKPPDDDGKRKLIGIDGTWYDITEFAKIHPGGPLISKFLGVDATIPFTNIRHPPSAMKVLKTLKQAGTYERRYCHEADPEFEALNKVFEEKGLFETEWSYYFREFLTIFGFLFIGVAMVVKFPGDYLVHFIAGVLMGLALTRAGFCMHDIEHMQLFRKDWRLNRLAGQFLGNFVMGISSQWWRLKHETHHACTNMVDLKDKWSDPDIREAAFTYAYTDKLLPLYPKNLLQKFFMKTQFITFWVMISNFVPYIYEYRSHFFETRRTGWILLLLHWCWFIYLESLVEGWWLRLFFTQVIHTTVGLTLVIPLAVHHLAGEFFHKDDFHTTSYYVKYATCTRNINGIAWFIDPIVAKHMEHHMFPRLACYKLDQATPYVRKICEKYDIPYVEKSLFGGCWEIAKELRKTGDTYLIGIPDIRD